MQKSPKSAQPPVSSTAVIVLALILTVALSVTIGLGFGFALTEALCQISPCF